ncbi:MAG TPA: methylated-DNA--[protein]-cysteine S-methyltransferase [Candidatus Paceibacterota bacterium]|nr:methylated-DNA--[protein]-cysteine S-methyltransferase [Candidatus Paceibacterota bacterium]
MHTEYKHIAKALQFIREHTKEQPSLEAVAKHVGMSPFHLQRLFTAWAGISPKKFLQYISIEHAKEVLREKGGTTTGASYKAGLSGTGRLHDLFIRIEGMTPGEYKNGGVGITIEYGFGTSAFGNYLVASTEKGICNILFFDAKKIEAVKELQSHWPQARIIKNNSRAHAGVHNFFAGKKRKRIVLHLKGTPFQIKAWEALLKIPEGQLTSYASLASTLGSGAFRAVGSAIGANPVAYLIPCHRVIKSVGNIGEYRWGATRKAAMTIHEAHKTRK